MEKMQINKQGRNSAELFNLSEEEIKRVNDVQSEIEKVMNDHSIGGDERYSISVQLMIDSAQSINELACSIYNFGCSVGNMQAGSNNSISQILKVLSNLED